MNILKVSKTDKEIVVKLNSDELVLLGNALYKAEAEEKGNLYYFLYSEIMLARDICQYGHIDNFCLEQIMKCREQVKPVK